MYLGIFQNETMVGTALIQLITSRLKKVFHCPHGPLLLMEYQKSGLNTFLQYYKKLGIQWKCDLVRISPLIQLQSTTGEFLEKEFTEQHFKPATVHLINPELTWVLNITGSEDEILKNMKKSTRYEVKKGLKSGIEVTMGNQSKDLDIFWSLHEATVKRQGFNPFPRSQTEKQLKSLGGDCQIFNATIEQHNYSSAVIIFDEQSAFYHQGASEYCKLPASHATLWSAILEAKKRGCTEFNFWGVSPADNSKHPWHGLSKFKRGFGGEEREYLHVHDYEITGKAKLNRLIEWYRKKKRKY